jgi:hypothetical protein
LTNAEQQQYMAMQYNSSTWSCSTWPCSTTAVHGHAVQQQYMAMQYKSEVRLIKLLGGSDGSSSCSALYSLVLCQGASSSIKAVHASSSNETNIISAATGHQ